jgi:membrane protein DedA with SNARE-associated domain
MIADAVPLLAIAGLILLKESGVPVPVPGDVVVLGAGVAASRGDLEPGLALAALIVASVVGGAIQFSLFRSVARPAVLRLLARIGSTGRVETQAERLRRRGARGVAVARVTPGLRIVAIAASALAGIPAGAFVIGLAAGNGVFIAAHFGLGYLLGEPVLTVVGGALGPIAILGIALAVVGAAGWLVLSRRRRAGRIEPRTAIVTALAWTDACCPACLALATIDAS